MYTHTDIRLAERLGRTGLDCLVRANLPCLPGFSLPLFLSNAKFQIRHPPQLSSDQLKLNSTQPCNPTHLFFLFFPILVTRFSLTHCTYIHSVMQFSHFSIFQAFHFRPSVLQGPVVVVVVVVSVSTLPGPTDTDATQYLPIYLPYLPKVTRWELN